MSYLKLGTRCTVLNGRPDRIGAVVEVIESPAGSKDDDVSYVIDFSGEEFFIAHCDLRPPDDIHASLDRHAKFANFDVAQGMIDGYNSLTPKEQELARKMGF